LLGGGRHGKDERSAKDQEQNGDSSRRQERDDRRETSFMCRVLSTGG